MFFISYGTRTGPAREPWGIRKGAVWHPCRHVRELTQPELAKISHGRRIRPYGVHTGPLRSPQGLFTGCLRSQNPYGTHKLIMHASKLYGPHMGMQNSYVAARALMAPWVDVRFLFKTAQEQPRSSPYGTRECDGTGALAVTKQL